MSKELNKDGMTLLKEYKEDFKQNFGEFVELRCMFSFMSYHFGLLQHCPNEEVTLETYMRFRQEHITNFTQEMSYAEEEDEEEFDKFLLNNAAYYESTRPVYGFGDNLKETPSPTNKPPPYQPVSPHVQQLEQQSRVTSQVP